MGVLAGVAALAAGAAPSQAAYGDAANVFGKITNKSGEYLRHFDTRLSVSPCAASVACARLQIGLLQPGPQSVSRSDQHRQHSSTSTIAFKVSL